MKKIKSIEDIRFKDFKLVEDKLARANELTVEEIIETLSILYQVDSEQLVDKDYKELMLKLLKVIEVIGKAEPSLITRFESDGIEYGFIPNFSEISTGELIDLDNLLADADFESIASILYRPVVSSDKKGRYTIEEYKGPNRTLFENASLLFYLGFINFFSKSWRILSQDFLQSTEDK